MCIMHMHGSGTFYFADRPRERGPIQKIGTMISTLKCRLWIPNMPKT